MATAYDSLKIKYIIIPLNPYGANVWDRPQPKSMGALFRRSIAIGIPQMAYEIVEPEGVGYALIEPIDRTKHEYIRVYEAGKVQMHAMVIELPKPATEVLVTLVAELIAAIRELTATILAWKK